MKRLLVGLVLSLFSFQVLSYDVIGIREIILVEKRVSGQHYSNPNLRTNLRGFKHCQIDDGGRVMLPSCRILGPQEFYSVNILEDVKVYEYVEATSKTLGGLASLAISFFATGSVLFGATVNEGFLFAGVISVPTISIGGVLPVRSMIELDNLNPVYQYRQAGTLSNDLLEDKNILKTDEDVVEVADMLDEILNYAFGR